jgi:hypothetical protein
MLGWHSGMGPSFLYKALMGTADGRYASVPHWAEVASQVSFPCTKLARNVKPHLHWLLYELVKTSSATYWFWTQWLPKYLQKRPTWQ